MIHLRDLFLGFGLSHTVLTIIHAPRMAFGHYTGSHPIGYFHDCTGSKGGSIDATLCENAAEAETVTSFQYLFDGQHNLASGHFQVSRLYTARVMDHLRVLERRH